MTALSEIPFELLGGPLDGLRIEKGYDCYRIYFPDAARKRRATYVGPEDSVFPPVPIPVLNYERRYDDPSRADFIGWEEN